MEEIDLVCKHLNCSKADAKNMPDDKFKKTLQEAYQGILFLLCLAQSAGDHNGKLLLESK